ncbi:MAG: M50 family metallopeptidase [Patescibacteria group bacterium]
MLFTAIIAFLVIFSLLILVHEWGHFIAARIFGVQVEEFGLGLPPKAKRLFRDKKKTAYTLNWLPLGGFVRMKGEEEHSQKLLKEPDSFAARPVWQRIIMVCAGVTMNLLAGYILFVLVFSLGQIFLSASESVDKVISDNPKAEFVSVQPLGMLVQDITEAAAVTGSELRRFDFISTIDGEVFTSSGEFQQLLILRASQPTTLSVLRREHRLEMVVTPDAEGKLGVVISGPLTAIKLRYPFLIAVTEAGKETWRLIGLVTGAIGGLFGNLLHGELPDDIGGPVAIAKETFYRASSLLALLNFAALLSITLAIFNILPIPALDGGRLLFLIYEGVLRRRPNPKIEARIHAAGYVLLLGLIVLISWQDIFR